MLQLSLFSVLFIAVFSQMSSQSAQIPIIDLAGVLVGESISGSKYDLISTSIHNALQDFGCFIIIGHGISVLKSNNFLEAERELFRLPQKTKESVAMASLDTFGRGYLGYGTESGLKSVFEPKEGYSFGHPNNELGDASNLLKHPNVWPANFSSDQIYNLHQLYLAKVKIAEYIYKTVAQHLMSTPKSSVSVIDENSLNDGARISLLRLFHYFPKTSMEYQSGITSQLSDVDILGSSPHTDWGLLTLIMEDDIGGLQFLHNGEWLNIPHVEGGIVVNGGDYLSLVSGGLYHSPIHRVLSPDLEERFSSVFFYYPHYDAEMKHVSCTASNKPSIMKDDESTCSGAASLVSQEKDTRHHLEGKVVFNTLLDQESENANEVFGDFIIRKWVGVSRTAY